MPRKTLVIFLFSAAFLLRLILIPNPGFEADMSFWKSWGLATKDFGIVEGIKQTNNNYPTPFAYTLGFMAWVYGLFADPHNFNEFWQNTNLLFLAISKFFPILADFGIAGILLYQTKSILLMSFYLFNPVSLIDGAWWGQVDSLGVFLFLLALLALLRSKHYFAGFLFMLSMMTKLQNMIYGPLFFLFAYQTTGLAGLARVATGALTGFFGLNIEFFLSKNMDRVLASLTSNYDYFPWMSLNAFNVWWIVAKAHGMQVTDKLTMIGLTNAKTIGLLLFSSFYLFALIRQKNLKTFLENLIIINAAFFLFMTESHDRYLFPTTVFLLLLSPFKGSTFKGYAFFSLVYFYNLHTALVFNYPHNGIPFLSQLIQPPVTIAASIMLITLFLVFVGRSVLLPLAIAALGLIVLNKPLLLKQPVFLTKLTPISSQQDYGSRQTNRSVNSFYGINSWNRLSVQYYFYRNGIGTHANSRHVFDINKKFNKFTTDYGMDTESGIQASSIFEIYGDDRLLFRSEKMGKFDLPRHAEIDVTGVKYLSLVTTDAGNGNVDDHTDWLNPILYQ